MASGDRERLEASRCSAIVWFPSTCKSSDNPDEGGTTRAIDRTGEHARLNALAATVHRPQFSTKEYQGNEN